MLATSQRMVRLVGLSTQNAVVPIHRQKLVYWAGVPGAQEVDSQVLLQPLQRLLLCPNPLPRLSPACQPCSSSFGPSCQVHSVRSPSLGPFCAGVAVSLVNATGLRVLNQQRRQDSPSLQTLSSMPGYTRLSHEYRGHPHQTLALPHLQPRTSLCRTPTLPSAVPHCPKVSLPQPTHLSGGLKLGSVESLRKGSVI